MQTQGSAAYGGPLSPLHMAASNVTPHTLQTLSSSQSRGLDRSFWGKNLKENSHFGKFKMIPSGDGHPVSSPIREMRAHYNQGFFYVSRFLDATVPCFPEGRNWNFSELPTRACRAETVQIEQMGARDWRVCGGWQGPSGLMPKADGMVSSEVSERPLESWGWLSLGVCGNALIMRVGKNSRCFHAQSYGQTNSCNYSTTFNVLDVPTRSTGDLYVCDETIHRTQISTVPVTATTKTRPGKSRKKRNQKKANTVARNLFERNLFHLCEVIFCSPSLNSHSTASTICNLSPGSLRDIVFAIKQVAAGLASVGVATMLFVVSKLSSMNATFEKHQVMSLVVGVSFVTLSVATMKFADVLKDVSGSNYKSKAPRKEHLMKIQQELHGLLLHTLPFLVICIVSIL